ncbi:MAG TPA: TIGR03000 domain-containing protein [Gemmataceae bacterium]|nr:TIGR03000 domain-containing protein [Gemmataceae bacterium]
MYSMVLMAALTTAVDMPDRGRRGGGCCGCYGGMAWGGCMGMGMGMGRWGGCYGMGYGGMGYGGYALGSWGGWGYGYSGYVLGGGMPVISGYAYSPMIYNYGTPIAGVNGAIVGPGVTRSLYYNPALANQANEATIVVHLPEDANLTIDGQPTQSRSSTRIFHSPPLEQGKTFTYTLRAEANRDGRFVSTKKTVDVRAGQRSEVTFHFDKANREENRRTIVPDEEAADQVPPVRSRRAPAAGSAPAPRSFPTPPPER